MLTSEQPELCSQIPGTVRKAFLMYSLKAAHIFCLTPVLRLSQTTHWLEIFQALLLSEICDLRHRGVVIVQNMMQAEKGLAATLMESEALEILTVLAKGREGTLDPVARVAQNCLNKAVEYGIIRSREDGKEKDKGTEP